MIFFALPTSAEKQQQQLDTTVDKQQEHEQRVTTTTTTITATDNNWQLERKYTLSQVQQHSSLDDCWMVIFDKVYNITEFVNEHPGGDFILLEYAGRDATHPFLSSRHGSSAYKMLDKYWIGILVDEELFYSNNSSYCSVYTNLSWRSNPTSEDDGRSDLATGSEQENNSEDNNNSTSTTTTSTGTGSEQDSTLSRSSGATKRGQQVVTVEGEADNETTTLRWFVN